MSEVLGPSLDMKHLKLISVHPILSKSAFPSWAAVPGLSFYISTPQTTIGEPTLRYYTVVSLVPIMPPSRTVSLSRWTRASLSPPVSLVSIFPLASF